MEQNPLKRPANRPAYLRRLSSRCDHQVIPEGLLLTNLFVFLSKNHSHQVTLEGLSSPKHLIRVKATAFTRIPHFVHANN